ncbi:hypothetical protein HD597_004449 [Nonomuraea thailandensis]|uniref:Lasso peptide biosynthesis PqqD family chaperone n=1 Tax=Nonomuraea thailandensis TaxID=1188745 RepID=A0A9X2K2I4_9ACTN|nr:lasso peptide biosynthesis PqqD family chaperone [Nonomuraea thailandensis]MCP2357429.1 hypothetical protein [Nonomuraea thailandensis]
MSLRLRAGVTLTPTGETAVLLDERTGRYWQLNATGVLVLRGLLAGQTPAGIAGTLTRACPEAASTAGADVAALLARLRAAGLVTGTPAHRRPV